MDSMTEGELDSDGKCILARKTRIQRISLGSGTFAEEVEELLAQYKKFARLVKGMLLEGIASAGAGSSAASGASSDRNMSKMQQQLSIFISPDTMKQLGGVSGVSSLMRQFEAGAGAKPEAPAKGKKKK